ncbi:MAG: 16S rRNA (cytosine(1402)-N(4))-methyltransferase RsmH [Cyanobacteria bacterium P01_A01_bin.114]
MDRPENFDPDNLDPEDPGSGETAGFVHVPVLPEAVLEGLNLQPGGVYLDATVGGGGHSRLVLAADPSVRLIAIDQDEVALRAARAHLALFGERVTFWHGNFADYNFAEHGSEASPSDRPGNTPKTALDGIKVDGVLADLGVSSPQLDTPERGFSFRQTAPLDMRMDQSQSLTAAEMINHWDEKSLADLFFNYGEERLSRRIARRIVERRPFQTTTELAEVIAYSVPAKYRYGRIHPATRVFQALRIAVNRELEVLEALLAQAPQWLRPGGRLVIISFHSLEDRRVKQGFRGHDLLKVITKKPLIATPAEISVNPRSRSAKLRVAERV